MPEKVLFVDDEPKILQAYKRTLRKEFDIVTAEGGKAALEILSTDKSFVVIVSDMQMPEMNGVELLAKVKSRHPSIVRVMLTGNADQQTARDAINTGDVYRFLNKPCAPEEMTAALKSAIQHYELMRVEQTLLEETVKGSIKALVEILSIVNPELFGRASVIRGYMLKIAKALKLESFWELEAAALLSQMGAVTLPEPLLERALKGMPITEEERDIYNKHPEICAKLINRIPKLENVADAIRHQNTAYNNDTDMSGSKIPLGGRILKILLDFASGEASGLSNSESFSKLKSTRDNYDPKIFALFELVIGGGDSQEKIKNINLAQLQEGMQIAGDVVTFSGLLLVKKGQIAGPSLIMRLQNFYRNRDIPEELTVYFN